MKKIYFGVIAIILCLSFAGCSKGENLNEKFYKFCNDDKENKEFLLDSGINSIIMNVEKEKKDNKPAVVIEIIFNNDEDEYKWLTLSDDEKRNNLIEVGKKFNSFASSINMNNDYHLYIETETVGCTLCDVYDYELDDLWISDYEETYINMYEKFKTFSFDEVKEQGEGTDFLIQNNLAIYKHEQLERKTNIVSYKVFVDEDGKLNSYGKDVSSIK